MNFKKKYIVYFIPLISFMLICLLLPLLADAANYKVKLNNDLAALGLNNGQWLYNSETDNLENKINNNSQCQSCKKTTTNGKVNYFDKAYKVEADFKDSARPWDGEISLPSANLTKGDKLVLVF